MVIKNNLEYAKAKLIYIIIIALFIVFVAWSLIHGIPDKDYNTVYIAGLLLLTYIFKILKNENYIYYSDKGNDLLIRYMFSHPLLNKRKAIKFPKKILADYEIKTSLLGLKKELKLFVKTKNGVIAYDYISISALSYKDLKSIEENLKKQIVFNKVPNLRK